MRIGILIPTIKGREEYLRRATYSVRWQTWNGRISKILIDNMRFTQDTAPREPRDWWDSDFRWVE